MCKRWHRTQPNLITEASVAQFTFSVFWLDQKGYAETLQSLSRAESLMSLAQLVAFCTASALTLSVPAVLPPYTLI